MIRRRNVALFFCLSIFILDSRGNAQISFGDQATNSNQNLFNILNKSSVSISTRNSLNTPSTRNSGSRCITPRGEPGVCSFISDFRCGEVLSAIQRVGITQQVINYLRRAIQPPCGFDRTDYTLCCKDSSVLPPPGPTPTSPTTTTTTTTTTTETQQPSSNICGITGFNTRVTGGKVSLPGVWPWAVILGQISNGNIEVICGGTLISDRHVLTAAHCFRGQRAITIARLGEHDITSDSDGATPQDIGVAQVSAHEGYNGVDLKNDIAIVTLSQSAVFTQRVRPACLPMPNDILPTNEAVIVGWGATSTRGPTVDKLREATVPLISASECDQFYSGIERITIDGRQICGRPGPRDSCSGDSGGPMLSDKISSRWTVIGVTSFGVECARNDFPGVYTSVQSYLPWINQRI
uniref:CLIP domain-containing serine protease n=1 Tax=Lepeophtheirus salmonis TaxID=72036 RepID=A0A0K2T669_LEPSM